MGSTGDAVRERPWLYSSNPPARDPAALFQQIFRESYLEIELPDEYIVLQVVRDSARNDQLIGAIVAPAKEQQKRMHILLMDRNDVPGIAVGRTLYLTRRSYGDCAVYRETLPR